MGLKKAKQPDIKHLMIHCDSQFVANQLRGEYAARNQKMEAYMRLAQRLFRNFKFAYIERLPRISKSHVDAFQTLAFAVESEMKRLIEVKFLPRPSIHAEQGRNLFYEI